MPVRSAALVALAAALVGCGGQRAKTARHLPAAIATAPVDAALLRLAHSSGTAELLHASTLVPREWIVSGGLPAIASILGASAEQQTVYAADNAGRLVAIDLMARKSHIIPTTARQFTATPDGTILGVDSGRHAVRLVNGTLTTFKTVIERGATLLRGPGDEVMSVSGKPPVLQVLNDKGEVGRFAIPNGRIATTWAGDLVAVVTDSGVTFVDPAAKPLSAGKRRGRGRPPAASIRIRGNPTLGTFSPSGHRLYVARKKGGLVMVDRFSHAQLQQLLLPGVADGMRVDRTGRWLLVHGAAGDSLWIVDLSLWSVALSRIAPWGSDLPQVVDGHTLLVRNHADLVAIDLEGATPPERGVLVGAGSDLYIMLPWTPRTATLVATPAGAADSAVIATQAPSRGAAPKRDSAGPDSARATAPLPPPPASLTPSEAAPGTPLYLQVSSSQNQDWAQAFAKQLKDGGFPARVLGPKSSDEGYRVVIGPYPTRAEAEAVGRRLGRSYFIIPAGSGDT